MEFKVKNSYSGNYKELIITIDNGKFESGLLDDEEKIAMVKQLLDATCDLLNYDDPRKDKLIDILEEFN